jgi:AsmA family protein
MRWLKIVGWIAGVLVALIIAAGAALYFGGTPAVAWVIRHPVSTALGRQISIDGPFTLRWGAPSVIVAENVHVANASWGSAPEMFSAKRIEIHFFARSFLHGPTHIPLIAIDGAKLLLETSKDGEGNWKFGNQTPKKRGEFPNLQRLTVHDSELDWHNGRTDARSTVALADLDYKAPDPAKPVSVTANGSFAATHAKLPLKIAGTVGALSQLRNPTEPYPVKFNGSLGDVDLAIEGTTEKPLDFAGLDLRLSLSGRKLDELGAALGVPFPELPDFRGTSELTGGHGNFTLKALSMALGKSDLEGGIAIDTNEKVPYAKAQLTSSQIDLADFDGLVGGKPAHSSAPEPTSKRDQGTDRIIPDKPINVQKLPGLNADLTFDGKRILSTTGLPFERVSLGLTLKDGQIWVKPLRFHAAQGDLDLNLHFTPFTEISPPKVGVKIDIQHVDLHDLLRTSSSPIVRETGGILGGFIVFDSNGTTMREMLARMNGDAGIFMQNGQLSELVQRLAPIDVLAALGVYVRGDRPLPINCLVSRFNIKSGVATASTLIFDTSETTVVGAGNLNFADETVTMKLTPYNKGVAAVSLRTPIDIGGTFANRTYHVETGNIVARLGAAVGLGVLFPPAALLPLIDTGLGQGNRCSAAYAAQQPEGNPKPKSGSSAPK